MTHCQVSGMRGVHRVYASAAAAAETATRVHIAIGDRFLIICHSARLPIQPPVC